MGYEMAARIAHLVAARNLAVACLELAPSSPYVREALEALTQEPGAGSPGGPARSDPHREKHPPTPDRWPESATRAPTALEVIGALKREIAKLSTALSTERIKNETLRRRMRIAA